MTRKSSKLIHEGKYAAEVPVELIEDDTAGRPISRLTTPASSTRFAWRCGAATLPRPQSTGACMN